MMIGIPTHSSIENLMIGITKCSHGKTKVVIKDIVKLSQNREEVRTITEGIFSLTRSFTVQESRLMRSDHVNIVDADGIAGTSVQQSIWIVLSVVSLIARVCVNVVSEDEDGEEDNVWRITVAGVNERTLSKKTPKVPVTTVYDDKETTLDATPDTGAEMSVIGVEEAEKLGAKTDNL